MISGPVSDATAVSVAEPTSERVRRPRDAVTKRTNRPGSCDSPIEAFWLSRPTAMHRPGRRQDHVPYRVYVGLLVAGLALLFSARATAPPSSICMRWTPEYGMMLSAITEYGRSSRGEHSSRPQCRGVLGEISSRACGSHRHRDIGADTEDNERPTVNHRRLFARLPTDRSQFSWSKCSAADAWNLTREGFRPLACALGGSGPAAGLSPRRSAPRGRPRPSFALGLDLAFAQE